MFLADTGDNFERRKHVQILEVTEPDALDGGALEVRVLPFRYPDGAHDAEALLAGAGALYVITKEAKSLGRVYRINVSDAGDVLAATWVQELRAPDGDAFTTAADLDPSGSRILLRTYGSVWEFRRDGARSVEEVLGARPRQVPARAQRQSESIAWSADDRSFLIGSEGAGQPMFRTDCVP